SDIYDTLSDVGIRVEGVEEAVGRFTWEEVYSAECITVWSTSVVSQEEGWEHAIMH
ncbi:hypothetical protein A2U01_0094736, partial [Trifolium medium]|nr:hypothetical protein [Trifolium medium]